MIYLKIRNDLALHALRNKIQNEMSWLVLRLTSGSLPHLGSSLLPPLTREFPYTYPPCWYVTRVTRTTDPEAEITNYDLGCTCNSSFERALKKKHHNG